MQRRKALALGGVVLTSTVVGCGGSGDEEQSPTEKEEQPPAEFEIEVDAPSSARLNENLIITTTVENVGGEPGRFSERFEYFNGYGIEPGRWRSRVFSGELSSGGERQFTRNFERWDPGFIHYKILDETGRVDVPGHRSPIITEASLVTEWNAPGDLEDNRITSATVGDLIIIAFVNWVFVDDGNFNIFEQIDIRDSEGTRVAANTFDDEQIFDLNGWETFEHALQFDTDGWDPGEYTADIRVRNNATDEVSESFTYDFIIE